MNIQDTSRSLADSVSNIMAGRSIEKVELTEAKETTVPFEKMNILTPDQWDQVQNFKNFNEKEWKWNAIQKKFIRLKKVKEEAVEEGNEFTAAAAKAKLAGKDEFEFDGKTYPVEIEQDAAEKILGKKESTDLEEAVKFWTVTVTKKAGKLFKGQTVDVKASNSAEAIKKGLKQMKVDNPMTVPSGSVDAVLAESLKEATKPSNGTSTVGLDVVDAKSAMKDMKKFKLKAKEGKGNGSADEVIVTGKNADIFKYLTSDYYDMDTDEIEEFYPELYEGVISNVVKSVAAKFDDAAVKKLIGAVNGSTAIEVIIELDKLSPKKRANLHRAITSWIERNSNNAAVKQLTRLQTSLKENVDLEEATMSQGVKTAATQIYSLEKSLKVGSNLNKGVNKSLEGKYDADFKKMQKAIGDIVSVWEEIERDFSDMNESTDLEEAVTPAERF